MNGFLPVTLPFSSGAGSLCCYQLDNERINVADLLPYCSLIPSEIKFSVKVRQIEFLAGRYCATQALLALGAKTPRIERHQDRSPIWPEGHCGSLSHSGGHVIACAGWLKDFDGMGIDIEKQIRSEMLPSLQQLALTRQDNELIQTQQHSVNQVATLIFSAKEAFYKFIYPQTQAVIDFIDVSMVALQDGKFTLEINKSLGDDWKKGRLVEGQYHYTGDYAVTLIAR